MKHILYNTTNIATFMHLDPNDIVKIEVLSKYQAIVFYNCNGEIKQRTISFVDVLPSDIKNRKVRSLYIEIKNNSDGTYTAKGKEAEYIIKPFSEKITCSCSDWCNLAAFDSERVACEHVYAYLQFLGFNSLHQYLSEMKSDKKRQETSSDSDLQA